MSVTTTASQKIRNILNHRILVNNILQSPSSYSLGDAETIDTETGQIFELSKLNKSVPNLNENVLLNGYVPKSPLKHIVDIFNIPIALLKNITVSLLSFYSVPSLYSVPKNRTIIYEIVSVKKLFARVQKIALVLQKFIELGGNSETISSLKIILDDMKQSVKDYELLKESIENKIMLPESEIQKINSRVKKTPFELLMTPKEQMEIKESVVQEQINQQLETLLCELNYIFSSIDGLSRIISRIVGNIEETKKHNLYTKLNEFLKEVVNEDFDNKLKEVITYANVKNELYAQKTQLEIEIEQRLLNIKKLMVGLEQYDDIFTTCSIENSPHSSPKSSPYSMPSSRAISTEPENSLVLKPSLTKMHWSPRKSSNISHPVVFTSIPTPIMTRKRLHPTEENSRKKARNSKSKSKSRSPFSIDGGKRKTSKTKNGNNIYK
jgi:hypothetical protein